MYNWTWHRRVVWFQNLSPAHNTNLFALSPQIQLRTTNDGARRRQINNRNCSTWAIPWCFYKISRSFDGVSTSIIWKKYHPPELKHRPIFPLLFEGENNRLYPWSAVVILFNPEGMGIWEWVILFSEIFEGMGIGMGMGMGNSIFFWNRYRVGEVVCVKKSRFFLVFKSLENEHFFSRK